jgi:hypothetical protein
MLISFTDYDINIISKTLESEPQKFENSWSWRLNDLDSKQTLVLTIYINVEFEAEKTGSLVSVQTQHGYFEMHNPTSYMIFEPDEIIFLQFDNLNVSSLVIGRRCTCSMFSNIERNILNADFTELAPPLLLAAMQLSIAESVIIGD